MQIHGHTQSMMGMSANKGPMRSAGFNSPEVALREPIEQDFSLNRRLAHQIYARDKMEGARERREITEALRQENAKKLHKKHDEEAKKIEKELKEATRQNKDLDTQADRLSENLRMEQETCNNLLETMKA